MTTIGLAEQTGRDYLSFSALKSYTDCSERFYLERVAGVAQDNGWWLPAGTAAHTATEWLDEGTYLSAELAWADAWAQAQRELTVQPTKAAGRVSKEWPEKENDAWWSAHGAGMVADYVTWRDRQYAAGWQLLSINDAPAVEVAVEARVGDTRIVGYIDRVYVDADGLVYVVDLKTSSRPPQSLQLEVYRYLLARTHGIEAHMGAYYMFRKGELTPPHALTLSDAWIEHYFRTAERGITSQVYLPNVGMLCSTCSVRAHCSVFGQPPLQGITTEEESNVST